ncbi:methyl-accepting chemotaxis protein [Gracilibacillus boraciitolerans JCM 21714]|uniref:Methyl-accepting chemotaxis protein n=1 Tax=Gracilibacillus boraciitolerans JCM 21714 TaxID=1298598 RepID=W4VGV2_9BACI|nr:methyl-accepting chemotaxis protein [Gracilibacillus boraciitolerans JCM 21714]
MKRNFIKSKGRNLSFRNVTVGSKFGIILSLVLVLFIIGTVIVGFMLDNVKSEIEAMERRAERAVNITEMGSLISAKSIRVFEYMEQQTSDVEEEYTARAQLIDTLETELEPNMNTEEEIALYEVLVELDDQLNRKFNEVVGYVRQGESEIAVRAASEADQIQLEAIENLEQLKILVEDDRKLAVKKALNSQAVALISLLTAVGISVIISIILMIIVSRKNC